MFFTYLRRELRRRRKAALVVASGLALGIALVIVVNSVSTGMSRAQGKVLESLYGLGTDLTVTKAQERPEDGSRPQRPRFEFQGKEEGEEQSSDRLMVQGFQTLADSTVASVAGQPGVDRAVGGLSLVNLKINGEFEQGRIQRGQTQQSRPGGENGGGNAQNGQNGGGSGPGDTVTGAARPSTSTPSRSTAPTSPHPTSAPSPPPPSPGAAPSRPPRPTPRWPSSTVPTPRSRDSTSVKN